MAKNRNSPRLSLNKLGEFTSASASRQRAILKEQKYPQDFKVTYYKDSTEAIASCVASNLEDTSVLDRKIQILSQKHPESVGQARIISANIDAIEAFALMLDKVDLKGATAELGEARPQVLTMHNVEISVRPEIILRGQGKTGPLIGAIKLHLSRTFSLNQESAAYVSAVLQLYCQSHFPDEGATSASYCSVIDVGSQNVFPGVASIRKRLKDLEAHCQNIAALWPTI